MTVKSLRKQLAAAIAMTLVATVALGSSTYAWFVTNNQVKATASTISAQSNAAFMKIKWNASAIESDLTEDVANIGDTPLYPAQWANNFDEDGTTTGEAVYQFETAYGTNPTSTGYAMVASTLKAVGAPEDAVDFDYAIDNVFYISSKGTDLANLRVAGAAITTAGNTHLDNALRVLVVCGEHWVLCDKSSILSDSEGHTGADLGKFGDGVTVTHDADTLVTLYVYYDGNDSEIYSNNLPNLEDASANITITFTAEPENY